ncbi:MAG TPA: UvrD-helicase domain-containing protein [Solirubrobacteraceae bacterium]
MEPVGAAVATGGPALTDEQEQATARRSEPLLVSAAAGSGKTSVLVERFVRAVREDGVAPARILAITFTERAAGELRERVRARLLQLGERQAARDTEAAFVGTFHGFCARLLRAHPLDVELDPDFVVLEESSSGRLRNRAFETALRELLAEPRSELTDLLAAYSVERVRTMVEQVYLELRSRGQHRPRLPPPHVAGDASDDDREAADVCRLLDELLERFGLVYERIKRARSSVDFDDLELLAQGLLLERAAVRTAWAERFELLMVDEFQDTNARQLAILRALDRENLFTVGDELQSIYGFRHADVSLFRARRAELQQRDGSLSLTHNFRSRAELLDVINGVFVERFADPPTLVAGREDSVPDEGVAAVELLVTDASGWEQDEQRSAAIAAGLPAAQPWRQAEARMLAQRVQELVRSGRAQAGEIVVLLRASGDLEVFERALQLCGLRTLAAVGTFWGHQQITDLVAYLRALTNPLDEEALYGVLASPLGGCSRDCLALLAGGARQSRVGVWELAETLVADLDTADGDTAGGELGTSLAPDDHRALATVVGLLARERRSISGHQIASLIERAIDASGYRGHVLALEWGERRLANVHKLLRLARDFEAREGRDLRAFLDHVEYLQGTAAIEPDAPVEGTEPDAVRLMTVHAAKGLEFPVVCLADLGRQPNARTPDLLVDGSRMGVRLMRLDGAASTPALDYDELSAERRAGEAAEEDRILYVAMTRARELLVLSGSLDFARGPRAGLGSAPISWLGLAISEQLADLLAAHERAPIDLSVGPGGVGGVRLLLNSPLTGTLHELPARSAPSVDAPEVSRAPALVSPLLPSGLSSAAAQTAGRSLAAPDSQLARISTLSYSSLTELERCGYRYYLERVLGIGEDRAAARSEAGEHGLEARARGTLVHRLMELLDFTRPDPPSAPDVAERARELGLVISTQEREEVARLIASTCGSELAARIAAASAIRREHPFAFALTPAEPLINGVIDLLAVEADGSSLVLDYKSDRVGADVDLAALVERDYAVQRLLYALAVLRDGAPAVEIIHWFLEPRRWVATRYLAADRLVLEEQLVQRLAKARAHPFVVSEHPHRGLCLTCPGRTGLCSWGESETLREHP